MDWSASTWWWVATGVLVAVEMATGTFYLLMLAVGTAAGALTAHLGLPLFGQMVAASVFGIGAVALWRRRRAGAQVPASANPDVNLDIGQRVHVAAWGPDDMAQVHYRGAAWRARYQGEAPAAPGEHVIRAIEGSTLVLGR